MSKVTVVVPCFNSERFLEHCVDSILSQSCEDLELILVNDGSTDGTPAICDAYAAKDARVRVIHQTNKGYSGARNVGIEAATGEYIMFVDSDDWIEPDVLADAVRGIEAENADYAIGGVNFTYYTDKSRAELHHVDTGVPEAPYYFRMKDLAVEGTKLWNTCGPMFYCVWSRMFRMDLIDAYHLRFNTSLRLQEDVNFTFCYMYHVDKVYVSDKVYYNYCREIDKDDTAEKDILEQYFYVEESLINFKRIAYKFQLDETYCKDMYFNLSEWFIKLGGKIYMESTGLTVEEQKAQVRYLADSFIFRYFCEQLPERDSFWGVAAEDLAKGDYEALYEHYASKLQEGVVPPCQ